MKKIGTIIRNRRNELKMSVLTLCDETGLSSHHIYNIERNEYTPTLLDLEIILNALDMEIELLITNKTKSK